MKHLLLFLFFISSFFCYSQKIEISTSSNKNYEIAKFWIDIKIINTTKDTLFVPRHPTFGTDKGMYDCYLEFLDPKTDTVIDIQPKGHYSYVILEDEKGVKLAPNQKYEFDYYMDNIYDLDPNRDYNVCLYMTFKGENEKVIISNSLLLPVHKGVKKKLKK